MTDADLSYLHPQLQPLAVPVASLIPDPANARKRDSRAIEALKSSIESRGFRSIIIVQKNEAGELIIRAGNGRHQAMTELGYSHIPALVFEEGDDEAVAFAIADNRTAELAEWDFEELSKHLSTLGDIGVDMNDLGWKDYEVENLLVADFTPAEPESDSAGEDFAREETVEEPPAEAPGPKGKTVTFTAEEADTLECILGVVSAETIMKVVAG